MTEFEPNTSPTRLQRLGRYIGEGLASLGNLAGPTLSPRLSEEDAIRRDWQAVGNDLQTAINGVKQRPLTKEDK